MFLAKIARLGFALGVALAFLTLWSGQAQAYPTFAKRENVNCVYCHINPGSKAWGYRGLYYKAHGNSFDGFDNIYEARLAGVTDPKASGAEAKPTVAVYPDQKTNVPDALKFTAKSIDGDTVNLARYQGSVIMVVNVASACGNTPQYADLEKMYEQNKDKGFVILGFPSNDFNGQEPGSDKEIKEFCTSKYKVTFPMFSKIVVKGDMQAPLYKFLTDPKTDPKFGKPIDWNFAKFLINRKGEVIARFPATMKPTDPAITSAVEAAIKEPKPGAGGDQTARLNLNGMYFVTQLLQPGRNLILPQTNTYLQAECTLMK